MICKEQIKNTQPCLCNVLHKPEDICVDLNSREKYLLTLSTKEFIFAYKNQIKQTITDYGFSLRTISLDDIDAVYAFIFTCFDAKYIEDISRFDIFRFIEYGHGLVIEDREQKIISCLFDVEYDKTQKISYSIRLGVDPKHKGKSLGRLITIYSSLLAMEQGAVLKRGLIDYNNFSSQHIHLNQLGWIFDGVYPNIKSLGYSFSISVPLTPQAFLSNKIDFKKLERYIEHHVEGVDFYKIKCDDLDRITALYAETDFRIVTVMKNALGDYYFIAFLASKMYV